MIKELLNDIASITYSVVWKIIFTLLKIILIILRPINLSRKRIDYIFEQLDNRPRIPQLAQSLLDVRKNYQSCVIFYCSSAGEYEQSRPLIDRLLKEPSLMIQVFFHSQSGLQYVNSRPDLNGPHVYYSLIPLTDTVWDWGWIFSVLRPMGTFFIRYEIWPGFLITARHYSKTSLVAASINANQKWIHTIYGKIIYRFFDSIYCISENDCSSFVTTYGVQEAALFHTGDPKYDRVYERAKNSVIKPVEKPLIRMVIDWKARWPNLRILIGGSIYLQDIPILLEAYKNLPQDISWVLMLVPHHVDHENTLAILEKCTKDHIASYVSSQFQSLGGPDNPKGCVILVDQMGFLAEIYALGHAAYIGGANHAQVHNVLEPAIQGLSLSWGPHYHNSREAEILVQYDLATPICDPKLLHQWWCALDDQTLEYNKSRLKELMNTMLGASDRILNHWLPMEPSRLHPKN